MHEYKKGCLVSTYRLHMFLGFGLSWARLSILRTEIGDRGLVQRGQNQRASCVIKTMKHISLAWSKWKCQMRKKFPQDVNQFADLKCWLRSHLQHAFSVSWPSVNWRFCYPVRKVRKLDHSWKIGILFGGMVFKLRRIHFRSLAAICLQALRRPLRSPEPVREISRIGSSRRAGGEDETGGPRQARHDHPGQEHQISGQPRQVLPVRLRRRKGSHSNTGVPKGKFLGMYASVSVLFVEAYR